MAGKITSVVVILAILAVLLVAAAVLANRPPLSRPPGPLERLKRYLSHNVAETGERAVLEELAPVWLDGEPGALLATVADAMRALEWRSVTVEVPRATVRAQVVSPLLRFTDDVVVVLVPMGDGRSEARIRSASRVGRGDLGANARHVMDLVAMLRRQAPATRP